MNDQKSENTVSALLVGEYDGDRGLLRELFGKLGWRLIEARDGRRAMAAAQRNHVQVVLAESPAGETSWQSLLENLRTLTNPPQLVVTSRTADDFLWAEVLNMGGFDVLARPFRREEVERVIASAVRHFQPPKATAAA